MSSDVDPHGWDRLLASVSPASILLVIQGWLGPGIARWHTAEDVWQETLLHAWRDRAAMPGADPGTFRRWLLGIARHRALDLRDHALAVKRGGGSEQRLSDLSSGSGGSLYAGPMAETTPSRAAIDREQAEAMLRALTDVPDEWREVVRLRLLEDATLADVAERLGLTEDAVRYRFARGIEIYRRRLHAHRAVSSDAGDPRGSGAGAGESAPPARAGVVVSRGGTLTIGGL